MAASLRRRAHAAVDSQNTGRLFLRRLLQEHAMLLREVAELRSLRDNAYHDSLTGLRNARYLHVRLREELQRGASLRSAVGAVVLLDINGFTRLNQGLGRSVGDQALRWLGQQLVDTLRISDVCCRTGADEFTLILPDTDGAGAEATVFRLMQAACATGGEKWQPLTLNSGLAVWPQDGDDVNVLLARATRTLAADRRRPGLGRARLRLVP
ncbi:MAG TPA: GGDEF domain-containing protein [Polyangia bacterium]|nr:GGDEF domain-containing protein [Polyangia bacterium]